MKTIIKQKSEIAKINEQNQFILEKSFFYYIKFFRKSGMDPPVHQKKSFFDF